MESNFGKLFTIILFSPILIVVNYFLLSYVEGIYQIDDTYPLLENVNTINLRPKVINTHIIHSILGFSFLVFCVCVTFLLKSSARPPSNNSCQFINVFCLYFSSSNLLVYFSYFGRFLYWP